MSSHLKRNVKWLEAMYKAKPKLNKAIIQAADKDLICCLCECAYNLIKNKDKLSYNHLKQLKVHGKDIKTLAAKKVSVKKKRKILQKGGFLAALLAPVVLDILGNVLVK